MSHQHSDKVRMSWLHSKPEQKMSQFLSRCSKNPLAFNKQVHSQTHMAQN